MKTFNLIYKGEKIEVYPHIDKYCNNDSLAIVLMIANTHDRFCNLTVNIPTRDYLNKKYFGDDLFSYQFVDTNNFPGAEKFIKDNKLGFFTGCMGLSGYCEYPLYKFNLEEFI